MRVWRGVPNNDLRSQHERGKTICWWGVSSCTEHLSTLEDSPFFGRHGLRTAFYISCFDAKDIASHSYFPKENELILLPGSYVQVKDVSTPAPDLYMIELQQI